MSSRKNKDIVLSCHGAWHGWSQGPNQLLDRKQFTEGIPRCSGLAVDFLRYGDIEDLKAKFTQYAGRIRAVAVEGILGDGGVITATQDWWEELFNLAANEDARILDDEILTGFRTGGLLAIPRGLAPDCITLGKALGFGLFPISAVVWRNSKLTLRPGIGVRTFNARPFQAAVVCAGIEIIEQQSLFERSTVLGRRLHTALASVVNDHPSVFKQVRGQGLFLGIELSDAYARRGRLVRDTMIRHGVLTEIESGIFSRKVPKNKRINETIRLTPPLTISDATISTALASFTSAAQELDSGLVKEAV